MNSRWNGGGRGVCGGMFLVGLLSVGLLGVGLAAAQQATFDSAPAALDALKAAVQDKNVDALRKIFGPAVEELKSGDPKEDQADLVAFGRRVARAARLEAAGDDKFIVLIGVEEHPFAVPIVRKDGKWFFDTAAGKEEILDRRIGDNELGTIRVCRGYVLAQREYGLTDWDGDDVLEYAQKIASTPGKRDGLYWPSKEDEPISPLGPLVAQARAEGRGAKPTTQPTTQPASAQPAQGPQPYHGYYYRILTRQGERAAGGKYDYVVNGHMVGGFALVAYPAQYGNDGIMTFIVNQRGKVWQKDLGAKTAEIAGDLKEYNPDDTWTLVED